ncbi:MAG: histidine kinase [Gemmatimonadota bacterium]
MSSYAESPSSVFTDRRALLSIVAVIALLIGTLLSIQAVIEIHRAGRTDPAWRMFLLVLPEWLFWAAAAPAIFEITRPRARRQPSLLVQILAAIALMLVHSAALYAWQRGFGLTDLQIPIWKGAIALSRWRLPKNVLAYGSLVALAIMSDLTRQAAEAARLAHERELQTSRMAGQLATARLAALRMQLHPHFLFNALNTVAMFARRGDGSAAVSVVAGLSDLLRQLLRDGGAAEITLEEELAFTHRYLSIEQARFGDALRVDFDVAPETLGARVPTLVLQPIVENALRHGLADAGGGRIEVNAERNGNYLCLEVIDNGAGIGEASEQGTGLGIRNTVERLQLLHGDLFDFTLENTVRGTVARIVLPFVSGTADRALA